MEEYQLTPIPISKVLPQFKAGPEIPGPPDQSVCIAVSAIAKDPTAIEINEIRTLLNISCSFNFD